MKDAKRITKSFFYLTLALMVFMAHFFLGLKGLSFWLGLLLASLLIEIFAFKAYLTIIVLGVFTYLSRVNPIIKKWWYWMASMLLYIFSVNVFLGIKQALLPIAEVSRKIQFDGNPHAGWVIHAMLSLAFFMLTSWWLYYKVAKIIK